MTSTDTRDTEALASLAPINFIDEAREEVGEENGDNNAHEVKLFCRCETMCSGRRAWFQVLRRWHVTLSLLSSTAL